eukprot:TRINITY_DN5989_c0_g3_i2.p2 TRINITY_DN5989_c0_g3~~TRINITY_DN5989_c0_g3_i2.p2  ORF type:complete len:456 (+),score=106.02 TRINITY_DN5989_c0_g3_i2:132-1499(+)
MKTDPRNITYTREKRIPHVLNEMLLHLLKTKPEDPMLSLVVFLQSGDGRNRLARDPSWWPKEDRRPPKSAAPTPAAPQQAQQKGAAAGSAAVVAPRARWPHTLSQHTWPRDGAGKSKGGGSRRRVWPHTLSASTYPRGVAWPYTLGERAWKRPTKKLPAKGQKQPRSVWPFTLSETTWIRGPVAAAGGRAAGQQGSAADGPRLPAGEGMAALSDAAGGRLHHLKYLDVTSRAPGEGLATVEAISNKGLAFLATLLDMAAPAIKSVWPHHLNTVIWSRPKGICLSTTLACRTPTVRWPDTISAELRPKTRVVRRWPFNLSVVVWPRAAGTFGPKSNPPRVKWPATLSCQSVAKRRGQGKTQGEALGLLLECSTPALRSLRLLTLRVPGDGLAAILSCRKKHHLALRHLEGSKPPSLHGGMIGTGVYLNEGIMSPKESMTLHGGLQGDGSVLLEGVL